MAVEASSPEPQRIPWPQHQAWLDHHWHAGQHVSVVGVTGGGKSYLFRHGLHPLWSDYRSLLVDVKGDDPTLAGLGQVVRSWREIEELERRRDAEPRAYRLIVPEWEYQPGRRRGTGLERAQEAVGTALHNAYREGRWLVYVDEARALTDSQNSFGLGLRGVLENIWQRGRSREVTLVAGTQQPVWMPSSFYSQPSFLYIARMLEPPTEHLREIGGRTQLMRELLPQLRRHEFLFVERDSGQMRIVRVGA
jgi:hypothetical protein